MKKYDIDEIGIMLGIIVCLVGLIWLTTPVFFFTFIWLGIGAVLIIHSIKKRK
jgi:uncharacterized membrane protein HdeD (DUF308 family)